MTTAQSGKICVLCGEDCSGKPRVKDPRGRYHCRTCYEEAAAAEEASASNDVPFAGIVHEDLFSSEHSHAPPVELAPAPRQFTPARSGGVIWPVIIGVICCVLGVFFALVLLLSFAAFLSVASESRTNVWTYGFIINCIMTIVNAMLFFGGIGLALRKAVAVYWLRMWSRISIMLTLAIGALFTVFVIVPIIVAVGEPVQASDVGVFIGVTLTVFGVCCAWPIFLLIWFNRDSVDDEIETWG